MNVAPRRPVERDQVPQLSRRRILILFLWPALWYSLLIYGLARAFLVEGSPLPTWVFLLVMVLGAGAEMAAAIVLLARERRNSPTLTLREQIRFTWPQRARTWIVALVAFAIGMSLSLVAAPLNGALASVPGFVPPDWWPILSNPTVPVASAADVFPDIALPGNVGFLTIFVLVGLVFNVFGEELYYRGYLLPRMRGAFGRADWIVNGVLFTLKHVYQRWLYPGVFVAGMSFAFLAGPVGSLPVAMIAHWLGNYVIPVVLLAKEVLGF